MIWNYLKFGNVATGFINGGTPDTKQPEYWDGGIPWITGADFSNFKVVLGRRNISAEGLKNSSSNLAKKNSLLLVTRTGVGKAAVAPCDVAISQDITAAILPDNISPQFALFWWMSLSTKLLAQAQGAIIKGVTRKDVEALPFPNITYKEQQKIVEILDQADALRQKRAQANQLSTRLLPVLFRHYFGDPVRNEKKWPTFPLSKYLDFLTSGSRGWATHYRTEGDLFLRIQNVGSGKLLLNDLTYVEAPQSAEADRTRTQKGDVLLSITADLGRSAWIPEGFPKAYINQHLALLRTKNIVPEFLSILLCHNSSKAIWGQKNRAAVKSGLNFDDIRTFSVISPPEPLQKEFAQKLTEIQNLELQREISTTQLETLFQVLLQRAFDSRLTASWREAHAKELLQEMKIQTGN